MSACDPSNPATTPSNLQAAVSHRNHSEQRERERGVVVGGRHSSVAEHWQLKPEALGLTPGGTNFLSFLCHFKGLQTVTARMVFN